LNIECPFDVPDEVFMDIVLKPDVLTHIAGTVEYSKEFCIE